MHAEMPRPCFEARAKSVKGSIEAYGGYIGVESTQGWAAMHNFTLPVG